jgi:hypothetical protein
MLRCSGLIGCDYKMMRNLIRTREEGPCLALYSPVGRVTSRFRERESTSRVRLGVLHTVHGIYSFLSKYFSTVVLVPHTNRYRATQVG